MQVFTDQRFVLTQKAAVMPSAGTSTRSLGVEAGSAVAGPVAALGAGASVPATVAIKSEPDGAGSALWSRSIQIQPGSTIKLIAPMPSKK